MVAFRVQRFDGMMPVADDWSLPETAASNAQNTWLYSGALQAMRAPTALHTCVGASIGRVFRLPKSYSDPSYLFGSTWLEFQNVDTDVVRAVVFGDTYDRYYWASSSDTPKYNTRARIEAGSPAWLLGIPTPGTVSVGTAGGGATVVSRAYAVTWVSTYGEEGAPSTSAVVSDHSDATWTVTLPAAAALDLGTNRTLAYANIYRTVTSTSGVATYFFVAQVAIGTGSYADTATDAVVSANAQLLSTTWTGPPSDLQGMVVMGNGIIAGWRSNEIWFCEPYRPHAWPAAYVLTVAYPIVGMGVVNQSLVVCTAGFPVLASGSTPSAITTSDIHMFAPCLARGSVLSTPEGVYYAAPDGLILVSSDGTADNITRNLASKDKWQQLTVLVGLRAARLGTAYYAFGTSRPGVFEDDTFETADAFAKDDFTGSFQGLMLDTLNPRLGITILSNASASAGVFNDSWSGEVFIIRNNIVYWLDFGNEAPTFETSVWRSKKFAISDRANLGVVQVFFEVPTGVTSDQYGTIKIYADDTLVCTRNITKTGKVMKLPSGFFANQYQFELNTPLKIISVKMASSASELRDLAGKRAQISEIYSP